MRWLLLGWIRQADCPAVVDQIDGGIAAVELPDLTIVYFPIETLPSGIREGDRVRVHVEAPNPDAGRGRRRRRHDP